MIRTFLRKIAGLELEEKILNAMLAVAIIGMFFPWIGGRPTLIDEEIEIYTGIGFHTSFIGMVVLGLLAYTILITILPLMTGNTLVGKEKMESIRLCTTGLSAILILASLSVLFKVTFQSPGMEIRFGIYVALIPSMIAFLYAFLGYQDKKRKEVHELFNHPQENKSIHKESEPKPIQTEPLMSPPPPPEAPQPEEHRLHR